MRKRTQISIAWYVIMDLLMAAIAWALFYFTRKIILKETIADQGQLQVNNQFWLGILFIPASWVILFTLAGSYHSLYKKSRLFEFTVTFVCSLLGSIVLFFAFLLDDVKENNYSYFYLAFLSLFLLHLVFIFTGRLALLNTAKKQLLNGTVYFNSLMIGNRITAIKVFKETQKNLKDGGFRYFGYLSPDPNGKMRWINYYPKLGSLSELETIIDQQDIKQVVIALEKTEHSLLETIIARLSEKDVEIKIQPDTIDILSGSVKTSNVMGAALIDLQNGSDARLATTCKTGARCHDLFAWR